MARKQLHGRLANVVPHPRYGSESVPSGLVGIEDHDAIRQQSRYRGEVVFPESAIPADVGKQNFSTMSHLYWYVDVLLTCWSCQRPFLFFAREQQYWYETLHFRLESTCHQCVECRASLRTTRRHLDRYNELVARTELGDADVRALATDVAFLWNRGMLANEQRLRRIRNLARRQIPDAAPTRELDRLVASLKAR